MPEESYQSLLREEYGWHDLLQRAQDLRKRAANLQQVQAQLSKLQQELANLDRRTLALGQLKQLLSADPDSDALLCLCATQAHAWLECEGAFAVEWAEAIVQLGLDWGQGPRLGSLRQLQVITRIIRTTQELLHKESFEETAAHALRIRDYTAEQHSGWQPLRQLLHQGLQQVIQKQQWDRVELLWGCLEQLTEPPELIDQEFKRCFGSALCTAIDTQCWPAIRWLWVYATKRYPDPQVPFWSEPEQHIQTYIQGQLDRIRRCDLDNEAIKSADNMARQAFATIMSLLTLTNNLSEQAWWSAIEQDIEDIHAAFEQVNNHWKMYQDQVQHQDWQQAVAHLDKIKQIPLDWSSAEPQFQQLRNQAIDHWLLQLQEQSAQIFNRADQAADFATLLDIYCTGQTQLEQLQALASQERQRIADTKIQQWLRTVQSEHNAATAAMNTLHDLTQTYEQAYNAPDPAVQLLLLLDVRKRCQAAVQESQGKWARFGASALLSQIEQHLVGKVEHAYRGLVDYYMLLSAIDGSPASYLLERARSNLPRIITDSSIRSELQQLLDQAPREFRLEVLRKSDPSRGKS